MEQTGAMQEEGPPGLRQSARYLAALLRLLRPAWGALARGALLGPVITLLLLVPPFLTRLLFDHVSSLKDLELLHVLVVSILAASVAAALAEALLGFYSSYLNIKLESSAALYLFNHLQHLPDRFFSRRQVGELTSRFEDAKAGMSLVLGLLRLVFSQFSFLIIIPFTLASLHWELALAALATLPFVVAVPLVMGRAMGHAWQEVMGVHGSLNALQVETLRQSRTTKVLALEPFIYQRAAGLMRSVLQAHLQAHGVEGRLRLFERTVEAAQTALFTWLGWRLILQGQLTLGGFVAFVAYAAYLRGPVIEVISFVTSLQQRGVHLQRFFEYLNETPEQDPNRSLQLPAPLARRLDGGVELENVSFGYAPEQDVLREVSARIEPGAVVTIVGASGSGKTTLARLLTRLEEPGQGRVLYDGRDARTLELSELRRQLAVVWQDVELYHGTLRDNLTLGLSDVSDEDLRQAVRLCGLESVLAALPQGYDTPVAEAGASLSGGQRQRLALARAVLRDAPVLLLDEATSQLDVETEAAIVHALLARARERRQTVLFITHRLANAPLADEVWMLAGGQLVGRGPHAELLARCAPYRRLYRTGVGEADAA
ncbi:peptidase domain-containing ABC transporter [Corallococcus sp. bb12-1]|uniref:peptidase domain-containing ABC transporter n=1 Tax=Corallococcus sp. bb12-1 TaxID=2996784 RepID=UPI00226E9856|nr:peptidase domain-containing ABC transporter [Corallococcus sp. bb12-1]MCY1040865.1 peptidase domain-containing ABC transporter [Corallococcus sp. bb12-1]